MRHGAAVSFRFSFSVAEGVVWARRVAAKEVERQHHRGRGVTEFVTLESAVWRTDPALSRNLKPPPLGGGVFTDEEEEQQPRETVLTQAPAIRDIEPIRFFYYGLSQADDAAACIYFYRVLEYYSFLTNKRQMSGFRHDTSLSDDDFTKQILQLITKDEKGPLLRLVNQIAGEQLLQQATTAGLIANANPSLLGEAIYAFRNSIVHGKASYGYDLQSTSVILESATFPSWRTILRPLARHAISAFGSKLL